MLNSPSKHILEEAERCFPELLGNNLSLHDNSSILHSDVCNQTLYEWMTSYVTPLYESHFLLALVYCCVVAVALVVGTVGNVLILIVSTTTRSMNRIGRDFVINLALADLCVTAIADPMCIIGVIKGQQWFDGRWLLCEVVASLCLTACFCAFFNLTLLTFNRYIFVCFNVWYNKIFKRPICIALCVLTWIAAFLLDFPNLVGWGDHYFDQKNHQCIWDRTASFSYTLLVSAGLIGTPLFTMAIWFVMIFYKIYKSKKEVFSLDLDDPLRLRRIWQEAWRSSRTLAIVFMAFLICWTPYAIITAYDVNDTISMETHLFVTLLAHLHSSLNFGIYMSSNRNFRVSVCRLVCCWWSSMKYRSSHETHKTNLKNGSDKMSFSTYSGSDANIIPKYFNVGHAYVKTRYNEATSQHGKENSFDDDVSSVADDGPQKY